jgi:hypothetical protein
MVLRSAVERKGFLLPKSAEERAWNNAHERCRKIVANYRDECGLFQITRQTQAAPVAAKEEGRGE